MPTVVRRKGGNHLLAIERKKPAQKENKKIREIAWDLQSLCWKVFQKFKS